MGMMVIVMAAMMILMMALGIGAFIVIGFSAMAGGAVAAKRKQHFINAISEKPKRSYLRLSDDGELIGIDEDEQAEIRNFK
ncbi:MAG: hypothetical protein BroJett018_21830 [Chloroflexota bacterium]|nr:hypothetical protein [Chloroflexota bacterium]NOG65474.1 hypothetical protein [Chloroflexota bacterium]GIK64389.1 MAG: hypothetical protein BroJett018_21830 [Chloroflexota bacterium]